MRAVLSGMAALMLLAACAAPSRDAPRVLKPHGLEHRAPALSPDGRWLLYGVIDHDRQKQYLEFLHLPGGRRSRVAEVPDATHPGQWSTDGRSVLAQANVAGTLRIGVLEVGEDGLRAPREWNWSDGRSPRWLPDGKSFVYFRCERTSVKDCAAGSLMAQDLAGGAPRLLVRDADPARGAWSQVSPDGRWIAFRRFSEQVECSSAPCADGPLWLRALAGGPERVLAHGTPLTWTPDARELWFTAGGAGMPHSLWRVEAGGGAPLRLLENTVAVRAYDPTRAWDGEGRRFALATRRGIAVLDRQGRVQAEFRDSCAPGLVTCVDTDGDLSWSRDGRHLFFSTRVQRAEGRVEGGIVSLDTHTGERVRLVDDSVEWR